jgi:DhnA family fructose-bisphosphate aldolase class Ia
MPLVVEPFYVMRVTRRGMRISKKPEDVMWIARRLDAQCPWITAFKLPLTKNFSQIVESLNSPVISLGGPKRAEVRDFLADTVSALKQGAAGVAYGRNVFQDRKPRALMHAVWAIVHEGANLGQAVQIYKVSE